MDGQTMELHALLHTLRTGINVRSGINVLVGKFSKNNKRTMWNKHTGGKILLQNYNFKAFSLSKISILNI